MEAEMRIGKKDLRLVTVCPDDTYYTWQVHLWLENLRERGLSDRAIVLLYIPKGRQFNEKWNQIINLYTEAEFVKYEDEHNNNNLVSIYIPILRPYTMWRWLTDFPEMKNKAIFYYDSDVLLTEHFNLDAYIDDDVNYVSDTNSYINASYFDSKIKDVLPDKLEEYKKIDVLDDVAKLVGIDRQTCELHNNDSGGAQYLLKDMDAKFWEKVKKDCINIYVYLGNINKMYFKDENTGFQKWCADMWAVLFNLWWRGDEVKVVKEMDFAWASDTIDKVDKMGIFHNAGIVSTKHAGSPAFYKAKYHQGANPFNDPLIQTILDDEGSKKWCTWWYTKKLKELHDKYKLNY